VARAGPRSALWVAIPDHGTALAFALSGNVGLRVRLMGSFVVRKTSDRLEGSWTVRMVASRRTGMPAFRRAVQHGAGADPDALLAGGRR